MNQESLKEVQRVQPEPVTQEQLVQQRKAARKTAIILGLVALGFFAWSIYIVMDHAAQ